MDLDKQLEHILAEFGIKGLDGEEPADIGVQATTKIKQVFKDAGYVHIPTGQNVTISTGDNEGGKLMTEQEWREKFVDA